MKDHSKKQFFSACYDVSAYDEIRNSFNLYAITCVLESTKHTLPRFEILNQTIERVITIS